jgi:hypothetical protein
MKKAKTTAFLKFGPRILYNKEEAAIYYAFSIIERFPVVIASLNDYKAGVARLNDYSLICIN